MFLFFFGVFLFFCHFENALVFSQSKFTLVFLTGRLQGTWVFCVFCLWRFPLFCLENAFAFLTGRIQGVNLRLLFSRGGVRALGYFVSFVSEVFPFHAVIRAYNYNFFQAYRRCPKPHIEPSRSPDGTARSDDLFRARFLRYVQVQYITRSQTGNNPPQGFF